MATSQQKVHSSSKEEKEPDHSRRCREQKRLSKCLQQGKRNLHGI